MKSICIFCAVFFFALKSSGQGLKLGAQAGYQVSTFHSGIARAGWKASALASYGLSRLKLSEQLGITVDNCSASLPTLPASNRWQYVWADATTVVSFVPLRKESYDITVGSGISVRRIIANNFNGEPATGDFDTRMYEWSYFLPVRVGVDFHLAGGREIACAIEYQVQVRKMHAPSEPANQWDYLVNKLYSVGLSVGYMFSLTR